MMIMVAPSFPVELQNVATPGELSTANYKL